MKITTTAFIFYKDKLLVVLHKKQKRWMQAGGHVEENEWLDEALRRELIEETGLDVEILGDNLHFSDEVMAGHQILKRPFFIHGRRRDAEKKLAFDYVCVAKTDKIVLKKDELDDYKWITEGEIDGLDTTDFFKEFAKKAFEFYRKNN